MPGISNAGMMMTDPDLAPDGRLLFAAAPAAGLLQLYQASGDAGLETYGNASPIGALVSGAEHHFAPFVTRSGDLWFTAWAGALRTVWKATASGMGGWGGPVQQLNALEASGAVLSDDELTLYVGVNPAGTGKFQVGAVHRSNKTVPFASPVTTLAGIPADGGLSTEPSWISADGCRLYFFRTDATHAEMWLGTR